MSMDVSENKLIHGDCIEVMKSIPDKSIDMVLCDLPYGVTAHEEDKVIPFNLLWEAYNRIIKDSGAILLFAQGLFYVDLVMSNRENFRYDLIWDKVLPSGFLNSGRMPLRVHEQIAVFYKNLPTYNPQMVKGAVLHGRGTAGEEKRKVLTNNNYGDFTYTPSRMDGMKFPKSILSYSKPHASVAKHRTEKSIPLLENLIKTYSNEGDIILDNCCGSGTTAIACLNTNRRYIAIEKCEEYYIVSKERIEQRLKELKSESFKKALF